MTIGISKEQLEEALRLLMADFGNHPNDPGVKTCLEGLLLNCEELNPWLPIEQAPKDRLVLIYRKSVLVDCAQLDGYSNTWKDRGGIRIMGEITHYQELPEPPK